MSTREVDERDLRDADDREYALAIEAASAMVDLHTLRRDVLHLAKQIAHIDDVEARLYANRLWDIARRPVSS